MQSLNEVYSGLSTRRRYEVWFIRVGLADNSGAWWFRYLLMNPGPGGCPGNPRGMPVQVWATWFPRDGQPQSFIQGFDVAGLELSARGKNPFHFRIGNNSITEGGCRGALQLDRHTVSWDLTYRSTFRGTLSNKGWIGFSRTPHSDALFSGRITLDGRSLAGDPLGYGMQGHNCGYRHRNFWTWAHAYFQRPDGAASTFEALVYEMPLGLFFRKAVLWHEAKQHVLHNFREGKRDRNDLLWDFRCLSGRRLQVEATFDGRGTSVHRLPYLKTDCTGSFEVANNSLAMATVSLRHANGAIGKLETTTGAVVEMVGG